VTSLAGLYAGLLWIASAACLGGLAFKVVQYWRVPAPLKIALTPAPVTTGGAALRVGREVVLFQSLFYSDRWLWIFAMAFHAGLALVLVRHLRYFQDPVWLPVVLAQPFGIYGGFAMLGGLFALLLRRIVLERVRYITNPSDILMLLLLIGIGASGYAMKFVNPTDIVALKSFIRGLMMLEVRALPSETCLLIHLALVALLMLVFPFSKLLHAPGIFFSPTRNQADNPREKRHLAPWAAKFEDKAHG
jgi:nitrate reductase gamma subunit